jgi:acetolactate decarboxylase
VSGTVVGFCFPEHNGQLNLPGRHLHFVSADHTRGGHVLACRLGEGLIRVDHEAEIEVELPPGVELAVHPDESSEELLRLERD